MVFSSSLFLLFFLPVFLILYYLTPVKLKNWTLLLFSVLFYSWGAPVFVFVVIGTTILDFYLVKEIHKTTVEKRKLLLMTISITISVGLLAYFKYVNFFIENFNALLKIINVTEVKWTRVVLPIGISFFTFQKITYSIDVYRKVHTPLKNVREYLVYILLFPQMIAGPIIRFNQIADQLEDRRLNETIENKVNGLFRFILGLSKKVLLANTLGAEVDSIFSMNYSELDTITAWIGIIAYSFQIYFDFSGYSDMAIGIGRMIGFKFPENFESPYISKNISEFWRRWHITLGQWMKDYLYIPLGGNRVTSNYRLYFNLSLVFLISGFWHGASWNFIIWGAFHGLFLILDRIFLIKSLNKIGQFPSVLITYIVVLFGWVIFRTETFGDALTYTKAMLLIKINPISFNTPDIKFISVMILSTIFSFLAFFKSGNNILNFFFNYSYSKKNYIMLTGIYAGLLILSISSILSSGFNPFIYFRF